MTIGLPLASSDVYDRLYKAAIKLGAELRLGKSAHNTQIYRITGSATAMKKLRGIYSKLLYNEQSGDITP